MPRRRTGTPPPYCLHRQSGRAYVRLNGQQVMLGPHGSAESRERYHRLVAEWEANGGHTDQAPEALLTVADLSADYLDHCAVYYRRRDGTPTGEVSNVRYSLRRLLAVYADLPASDFGVRQVKTVRHEMIRDGLSRNYVNDSVARIIRMFRWAAENERLAPDLYGRLRTVRRLQAGRTNARETAPRSPVSEADMRAALPHLSGQIEALVLVMWHTGMRCGEAVQLRNRDVDTSGSVWVFRPSQHKSAHRGTTREIDIGPAAQAVLRPFVQLDPDRYWFRPCDVDRERRDQQRAQRRTPLWPSHLRARARKRRSRPQRTPGEIYTTQAVGRAIRRACERAGIKPWSPHQLRHAALTRIRKLFGIEAAIAVGGHSTLDMAEHYTRQSKRALSARIMEETG